jgi:hypothetical protein
MIDWGAKENTQAFILDCMLQEGGHTLDEMMKAVNSTKARVRSHMNARIIKYNVSFIRDARGKYYMKEKKEKKETKKIMKGLDIEI